MPTRETDIPAIEPNLIRRSKVPVVWCVGDQEIMEQRNDGVRDIDIAVFGQG